MEASQEGFTRYLRRVWHWRDWSITVRLALTLFLAALIPMSLTAWYNLQGSLTSVEDTAYDNLELVAQSTANHVDQIMTDTNNSVIQMSGDISVQRYLQARYNGDDAADYEADATAALQNILDSNPYYEFTYILDNTGYVPISRQLEGLTTVQDKTFADRDYFLQAMMGQTYNDILIGRTTGRLGLYFSAPVTDPTGSMIVGVAVIKVRGDLGNDSPIAEIVRGLKVGDSGYAFIVDQDGVVVVHPDATLNYHSLAPLSLDEEDRVGDRFAIAGCGDDDASTICTVPNLGLSGLMDELLKGKIGHLTYTYGDEQIAGFAPLHQINWYVVVSQPHDEFSAPLTSLANQSALSVVVVGILALGIGLVLAGTIARPIKKLARVARDVESDKPFTPNSLADVMQGQNELGNLARVFSNMVVALHARMTELRTIYDIGTSISSSVELRPTLYYLIRALSQAIPHDGAEICLYDKNANKMVVNLSVGKNVGQTLTTSRTYEIQGFLTQLVGKGSVLVRDMAQVDSPETNAPRAWQQYQPKSYLGVPLIAKNNVIGTIELVSTNANGFNEDNQRILESIAIQAAIAIQNAQDVENREKDLKQQIVLLRIEVDEAKKSKQVSEIVDSEYFQILRQKAKDLRAKRE